uniref:tryptophan synthase alpha subunit n=1 Tax=Caulacanthus ustulatus TaxID=31411 RepID=UPI0027DA2053|nr:tryptophan synthase alpha subunit [Caulacanthus ustulatus]WCH57270.1 tryptophan synthase alpha subunit [Caulacanthus ustulatus]
MTIISDLLLKKNSKCALVPFVTAGYPNLSSTVDVLYTLDTHGADIIELGIPYAYALADGPVIQESSKVALEQGVNFDQIIDMLKSVVPNLNVPVVLFTYYNPILVKGIENFIIDSSISGVKGLIIPDLPLEEADFLIELCNRYNIELILFVAPTSSQTRISSIVSKSPGCIYLVSSCGVTGIRNEISFQVSSLAKQIKDSTNKAVIVGFGISDQYQAARVSQWNVDGVVIGSAFIKSMFDKTPDEAVKSLGLFCKSIRHAIDSNC